MLFRGRNVRNALGISVLGCTCIPYTTSGYAYGQQFVSFGSNDVVIIELMYKLRRILGLLYLTTNCIPVTY